MLKRVGAVSWRQNSAEKVFWLGAVSSPVSRGNTQAYRATSSSISAFWHRGSKKNLISTGPGWLDHSHHTVLSIALDRWDPSELTKTAILYLAWSLLLFLGCNGIPKMKRSKYVTPLLKFFQKKFFGTNERRRCLAFKRNVWIR